MNNMTINEAKERLTAVLAGLDKLAEAVGGEECVNEVIVSATTGIYLPSETMRTVVAAFPELNTSLEPMGTRWSMDIDGVDVHAILLDGETPEE